MNLQNELENNRDGTVRVGSTILSSNNGNNSQTTNDTVNLHKSNDDKSMQNHKQDALSTIEKQNAIDINSSSSSSCSSNKNTKLDSLNDTVIEKTETDACDKPIHVKCDDIVDDDDSSSSNSPSASDTVFNATKKPTLANLRKMNAPPPPPTVVPLSSPPNVPMFLNRFPNTHPTYLPPHIRNLPKTQSLDLADNEMPSALLTTKQTSFEQNRPIYPNVPYSPYGSPFGSPRNRRRGPLRESRRISIEQSGSFLQLNQYKLMDQIGQVNAQHSISNESFFCLFVVLPFPL